MPNIFSVSLILLVKLCNYFTNPSIMAKSSANLMKPTCWAFSLVPVCYFLLGIDKSEQYGEDMEETKEQQGIKQGLA